MLRILIAPDKFKGSLSAEEICQLLANLWSQEGEIVCCPLSDGGEGFVDTLRSAMGGESVSLTVADALGRPVVATYARCGDLAILEMARASGLGLLSHAERDPWRASTLGTGQMMDHAVAAGARKLLLGIGGSATNDGGVGMALALGYRFWDATGNELLDLPAQLMAVRTIQPPEQPFTIPVEVACDVVNPLLGPNGATRIYGPQKGVQSHELESHENRLAHLVKLVGSTGPNHADALPGSGAAGGLGYGLQVFAGAKLTPGFDLVADTLDLDAKLGWADVVVTGEGQLDASSLSGKAPVAIARRARALGKRVIALCGRCQETARPALAEIFHQIIPISPPDLPPQDAMHLARAFLQAAAQPSGNGTIRFR